MNNGIFGFPNINDSNIFSVREFDTSGTYAIPQTAKRIMIFAVGGGGGGGGGVRRGAPLGGGNGGAAGAYVLTEIPVKAFGNIRTLNIVIGAGGIGGSAPTSNNGSPGTATSGGNTEIWIPGKTSPLIVAGGNKFGSAATGSGVSSTPASGNASGINILFGTLTASSGKNLQESGSRSITNLMASTNDRFGGGLGGFGGNGTGGSIYPLSPLECAGAGGGGVLNVVFGVSTPFMGGSIYTPTASVFNTTVDPEVNGISRMGDIDYPGGFTLCAGSTVGSGNTGESANRLINPYMIFSAGLGGAGGGGATSGRAGSGGNGYRGGGGGGGGGSVNGISAGAGGNGGNGYVKIIAVG